MLVSEALSNQSIIVTGGGSGLGRSMATRFAELGARVMLAGRTASRLDEAAREIQETTGASVATCPTDVRSYEACERLVEQTVAELGSLEGVVNNAAGNFLCPTEDLSPGGFSAVVDIVLKGTFHMTLAAGRRMIADGTKGSFLAIATPYAETGSAFVVPSAAAKAGVVTMSRSLAVEWGSAYGIRSNVISPGPFRTEGAWKALMPNEAMEAEARAEIPLGRFGDHRELADLAAFLMSPFAGYMNGACITIDGGKCLQGAGEFNRLVRMDREALKKTLQAMRPPR